MLRIVSVAVVVGAEDGLLVIVDGRKTVMDKDGTRRSVCDQQRKFAVSRGRSAVLVLVGPAKLAGKDAWEWAEEALSQVPADNGSPLTTRDLLRTVSRELESALAVDNWNRRNQDLPPAGAIQALFAHVSAPPLEPQPVMNQVWTIALDGERTEDPTKAQAFGGHRNDAPAILGIPGPSLFEHPDADGLGAWPADLIRARMAERLAGLESCRIVDVRSLVDNVMVDLIEANPLPFIRRGVGGTWSLIEIRAGREPEVLKRAWGPSDG